MTTAQHIPIAVVGVSALFPGSVDKTSFWRNILEERDLIGAWFYQGAKTDLE